MKTNNQKTKSIKKEENVTYADVPKMKRIKFVLSPNLHAKNIWSKSFGKIVKCSRVFGSES